MAGEAGSPHRKGSDGGGIWVRRVASARAVAIGRDARATYVVLRVGCDILVLVAVLVGYRIVAKVWRMIWHN